MNPDPAHPYNTLRRSRHEIETRPPLPPAHLVKYSCGCGYQTDWFLIQDDELARGEMRKHDASCIDPRQ
jgi:hypothetical protein